MTSDENSEDPGVPTPPGPTRKRSLWRRLWRLVSRLTLLAVAAVLLWVGAYRWINPPLTHTIATERLRLGHIEQNWTPIEAIPDHAVLAFIAAEDARFCDHHGFDWTAIEQAWADRQAGRRFRGASTISQQVAKNVFLWQDGGWFRKGLEAGFTLLVETFWPKRRIAEVYLNVAEMGEGVFGLSAAANRHFGRAPARLTLRQSALIAAALPAPRSRNPARASAFLNRRAGAIASGARTLRARLGGAPPPCG